MSFMAETSVIQSHHLDQIKKPLKLFGIEVYEEDNSSSAHQTAVQQEIGINPGVDTRKIYECRYCFREFTNSQAMGGHQNAHKKERQQLRRAQMNAIRIRTAGTYGFRPVLSGSIIFSPHSSRTVLDDPTDDRNCRVPMMLSSPPIPTWNYHTSSAFAGRTFMAFNSSPRTVEETPTTSCNIFPSPMFPMSSYTYRDTSQGSTAYTSSNPSVSFSSSKFPGNCTDVGGVASDQELSLDLHLTIGPSVPWKT